MSAFISSAPSVLWVGQTKPAKKEFPEGATTIGGAGATTIAGAPKQRPSESGPPTSRSLEQKSGNVNNNKKMTLKVKKMRMIIYKKEKN
jgi:hypothetical protein